MNADNKTTSGALHSEAVQSGLAALKGQLERRDLLTLPARPEPVQLRTPVNSGRGPVATTVIVTGKGTTVRSEPYAGATPGFRLSRTPMPEQTMAQREATAYRHLKALGLEGKVPLTFYWGTNAYVQLTIAGRKLEVEHDVLPSLFAVIKMFDLHKRVPDTKSLEDLNIPATGLLSSKTIRQRVKARLAKSKAKAAAKAAAPKRKSKPTKTAIKAKAKVASKAKTRAKSKKKA